MAVSDERDDKQKQMPCVFSLKKMGWKAMPRILEFLKEKRSREELGYIAEIPERVCSRESLAPFSKRS